MAAAKPRIYTRQELIAKTPEGLYDVIPGPLSRTEKALIVASSVMKYGLPVDEEKLADSVNAMIDAFDAQGVDGDGFWDDAAKVTTFAPFIDAPSSREMTRALAACLTALRGSGGAVTPPAVNDTATKANTEAILGADGMKFFPLILTTMQHMKLVKKDAEGKLSFENELHRSADPPTLAMVKALWGPDPLKLSNVYNENQGTTELPDYIQSAWSARLAHHPISVKLSQNMGACDDAVTKIADIPEIGNRYTLGGDDALDHLILTALLATFISKKWTFGVPNRVSISLFHNALKTKSLDECSALNVRSLNMDKPSHGVMEYYRPMIESCGTVFGVEGDLKSNATSQVVGAKRKNREGAGDYIQILPADASSPKVDENFCLFCGCVPRHPSGQCTHSNIMAIATIVSGKPDLWMPRPTGANKALLIKDKWLPSDLGKITLKMKNFS